MTKAAIPVYIQIHNQIRHEIEQGKWPIGSRIPSERKLALDFHVSRMTLRQALQTLVDEGILERHVGAGTYVANQKVQEKVAGVTSFTDLMKAQGRKPSSKTVSYHLAQPSISECDHLKISENTQVLRMERIRYADNVPICFEVTTVPADMIRDFSKSEVTRSFYHALERRGYQLGGAQQIVSATVANEQIADYLKIHRGDALLLMRQITCLHSGQPFEYVRTQYVGDRFEFYLKR